jgi:predicted alternative tryptophan synthase beta-subunit
MILRQKRLSRTSPMFQARQLEALCKCGKKIYESLRAAEIASIYKSSTSAYKCRYKNYHIGRKRE